MATIEDVKNAADAAERQRGYAQEALNLVNEAKDKAEARGPKNAAVTAAAAARRQSIEAWTAAMEVNTAEAKYHADRANKAAEAAETDAMKAVAAYNKKPD